MQGYKLLLVGCGELGSRHLQAISTLPKIAEIYAVDPRDESLILGRERLKEIVGINKTIQFFWHRELDDQAIGGDLCIVATQARGRCALIKQIVQQLGYKKFLIEKIVAQSVAEYKDLMRFCEAKGVSVWVNCKTRAYGIHQYIKSKLDPREPIIFTRLGGNHGLASNGIHGVDLFNFYDGSTQIKSAGARVDQILHTTKRGQFDLSGSLYGYTDKGSDLTISFSAQHESPDLISIVSPRGRFIVDHFQQWAQESCPENDWKWKTIPIQENWMVSYMSKTFVLDILTKGSCVLPNLKDCFPAHEFILEQLLPHFNKLLKVNNDYCPVT